MRIPVVLDGVRYEPEEFNLIHKKLHSEGVHMGFVVNPEDGALYAFTKIEGFDEFAAKQGLSPYYRPSGEERPGKIVKDGDGNIYVFGPNSKDMDIHLVR